jgi:hypothetical protein
VLARATAKQQCVEGTDGDDKLAATWRGPRRILGRLVGNNVLYAVVEGLPCTPSLRRPRATDRVVQNAGADTTYISSPPRWVAIAATGIRRVKCQGLELLTSQKKRARCRSPHHGRGRSRVSHPLVRQGPHQRDLGAARRAPSLRTGDAGNIDVVKAY